jgi:hypothetical protein
MRAGRIGLLVFALLTLLSPPLAGSRLSSSNPTPFPQSKAIVGAYWTSRRYDPPKNQWGDILPMVWADDGNEYTVMDDGGTDIPAGGPLWSHSFARVTGKPPNVHFTYIGDPKDPPPHTWVQIAKDMAAHRGPLGPFYSTGLLAAGGNLFATQQLNWNWNTNAPFTGLEGIAYSTDRGRHWHDVAKRFPAPLGNLNFVIRGRGGYFADGYAYAIGTEREFNASTLVIGRARPDIADLTDPAKWQWLSGFSDGSTGQPVFSSQGTAPAPIVSWASHITYPQMAYDAPLHRYLLTFTFQYASTPPSTWKNGSELVILEAPNPWGPFSYVAHEPNFGPSNGYSAGFPVSWISPNGRDLWLKWAANFAGCAPKLDCSGAYGFNYRRLHLVIAGDR